MSCLESVLQQPGQTPVCRAEHNHTVTGNRNWLGNRSFCQTSRLLPGLRTGQIQAIACSNTPEVSTALA